MMDIIEDLPDNVVAIRCRGHVTKSDYKRVLIPNIEAKRTRHERLRLFYSIGPEFEAIDPGAIIEDIEIGFSTFSFWERVAVITDILSIRVTVRAFSILFPCPVRFFTLAREAEARDWIVETN